MAGIVTDLHPVSVAGFRILIFRETKPFLFRTKVKHDLHVSLLVKSAIFSGQQVLLNVTDMESQINFDLTFQLS